jgi:hypothetical protein
MSDPLELDMQPGVPGQPGTFSFTTDAPRDRDDYIDRRLSAVGYSIYLGGYQIYLSETPIPIFLPEYLVLEGVREAYSIGNRVYDDYRTAAEAARAAPPAAGVSDRFAYFRAPGGVVAPTFFSPVTTPRIIATIQTARASLATEVQEGLVILVATFLGGGILRQIAGRIVRVAAEGLGARSAASGAETRAVGVAPRPAPGGTARPGAGTGTATAQVPSAASRSTVSAPGVPGRTTQPGISVRTRIRAGSAGGSGAGASAERWGVGQVRVLEMSSDARNVRTWAITTPNGEIRIMGELSRQGGHVIVRGTHIQVTGGPNSVGAFRTYARALGRFYGARRITIYPGVRTTPGYEGQQYRPIDLTIDDQSRNP